MYEVIIKNGSVETVIHYPTADKDAPHLLKMDLKEKAGQAAQFTFTIPYMNSGYALIFDLITLVKIVDINTGELLFEGRVYNSEPSMSSAGEFTKDVVCEGELAYLNDTRVRLWTIVNMSVGDFIAKVINNHNAHTTADKQIQVGNIDITGSITCTTNYENSLNCIIEKVVNVFGGYLVIRKVNDIRYLDYLSQIPGTSANIELANNMKDIAFSKDVTNIATRVIPIGKDNLTIESVNNGVDYLENVDAVAEYGVIEQTLEFKDITDAGTLKTQSQAKLDDISKATYKLNTNVLDLSLLGIDSHGFICGTDTNISNLVLNINEIFNIIEKDTDLLSPQNCKITLNDKFETGTDRQIALQRIAQFVNKIFTADKQVNTFYLDGYINLLKNQMGAMADTAEKQLAKAILFEDKVPGSSTFGAMALGTQGFMIADTIVNGDWDWRTFGSGKGFVADLIVAGKILGGAVEFDLDAGTLKITHLDGSYTLLDANGLKWHNGATSKDYHYLTCFGTFNINATSSALITRTVQLPDEFKGKDFKVLVTLENVRSQSGSPGYFLGVGCFAWDTDYDIANGTFKVYAGQEYTADNNYNYIDVGYIAIA